MADALITLKLTPAEFDLLRSALQGEIDGDMAITREREAPADVRSAARTRAARLGELLAKLK